MFAVPITSKSADSAKVQTDLTDEEFWDFWESISRVNIEFIKF